MKKTIRKIIVIALSLYSAMSIADTDPSSANTASSETEEKKWSADLFFVTEYITRGLTQTERHPALQADFCYHLPYHFHLDFFTSNVRFPGSHTRQEIDTGFGYTIPLEGDNELNLIYMRYTYPRDHTFNYNELQFTFGTGPLAWQGAYSLNVNDSHHPGLYLAATASHEIPSKLFFGVSGVDAKFTLGHDWLPKQAGQSYTQIEGGFQKAIDPMTYSLIFSTTHPKQERSHLVFSAQYSTDG